MKSTQRALRRHHRARMIRHALRVVSQFMENATAEERRARAVRWHNHLKRCSCYLCGNRRTYDGRPTWQEEKALDAARRGTELD